jgi:hypothetical protein
MKYYKITLEMGNDTQGDNIRLTDFITELTRFTDVARNAEEVVSGRPSRSIYYRVTALRHSSPARVTLEACARDPEFDIREDTLKEISSTMANLKKGKAIPGDKRFHLVDSMKNFVDPVGTRISHLRVIIGGGRKINLDEDFKVRANLYVAPEESCASTARGMLDAINIHGPDRIFWLYPEIGPSKIQCIFPEKMFETAKIALGKRIEITGNFLYKVNAPYAHLAEVEEMIIFPSDEELPKFNDLFGIDPSITMGLSCEDYMGNIRSEN